jgi:4-aminobutyrate aminotransferase/(S)-3-amino-2-methylpropionate transaminase
MDAPHVGGLGGTFGGNPVACAAALATIATIERDGLIERAQQIERVMTEPLLRLQAADDRVGDVRGRGAMIAVELVKTGTAEPDAELAQALSTAAHAAGVIVLTCGMFGNIVRLLPPLTISDELLVEGIDVLSRSLGDL